MQKRLWTAMLAIVACWSAGAEAQAGEVSFEALWSHASEHSPELSYVKSQVSRVDAARARARGVLADNPMLSVQAGPRFQGSGRSYDLSAGISQPLRIAGQPRQERALASAVEKRVEAELAEATWALRQRLHAVYREAATARAGADLAATVLAFEERVYALVKKQVAAGEASPLKERLAEIEVVQARQAMVAENQHLLEHRLTLAQLSGTPAASPPMPLPDLERVELPPLEQLVRDAQARAPALRTLQARASEASAAVRVADKQSAPQPELGAAYVREGSTPAAGPVSHSVIASLALPIPLWFRNQGERASARAELTLASARLASSSHTLEVEVARMRSRVQASEERLTMYAQTLMPKLAEQLALLERALSLGELDVFDVATFRARALEAQRDALAAREEYSEALSELETWIGFELPAKPPGGAP